MKNGICKREYLMAAVITSIASSTRYPVVLGNPVTLLAVDTFRPTMILNPIKTSSIIGEFLVKILYGILYHM
jgi:hypothetical protein